MIIMVKIMVTRITFKQNVYIRMSKKKNKSLTRKTEIMLQSPLLRCQ